MLIINREINNNTNTNTITITNTIDSNTNTNTNTNIINSNTNTNIINSNTIDSNTIDSNEKIHYDFLLELEEIKNLNSKIDEIFVNDNNYSNNNYNNSIIFNYNFKKEYTGGFIEYKRTLSSYANKKTNKLIRQIYWRIYEGLLTEILNICYYIIGLEDSGIPSKISQEELEISIKIISDAMKEVDISYRYLYLKNTELNYNFVIVKFSLDEKIKKIEYF
jgi:hypothetical protein